MRVLVIGDIHGGLKALVQILDKAKVKKTDTLIFLGDYVDGWSDTPGVIDYLIDFSKTHFCIFIKGNHDDMLCNYLKKGIVDCKWNLHGGSISIKNYKNIASEVIKKHISFFENLQDYYIDKKNRLFIHAGFSHVRGVKEEFYPSVYYWDRTLWETAVSLDERISESSVLYPKRLSNYSEIYIGHTPTLHMQSEIPIKKANVWNVDTGAAFTGKLSIMDIDSKEFWQSDPLLDLYLGEEGRN